MAPSVPANYELASIRTADQAVMYQLTQSDVLWAARAAAREAEREAPAVLWAFTQLTALTRLRVPDATFTGVIRGFSQPVNPIWARDGAMCRPGGPYHGKAECSPDKLDARDWYTNATWDQLTRKHPDVVAVTQAWARGLVNNPIPRAANFAAPKVAKRYLDKHPNSSLLYAGDNWYIVDGETADWPDNFVTIEGPRGAIAGYFPTGGQQVGAMLAALLSGATQWWRGA